jgi:hypothetical protein
MLVRHRELRIRRINMPESKNCICWTASWVIDDQTLYPGDYDRAEEGPARGSWASDNAPSRRDGHRTLRPRVR